MVTNTTSSGGGGEHFEQHVGAAFLALLLVRGIPPCLTDCQIEEVQFQAEYLGNQTDDLLIIGRTESNQQRRLLASVKRSFTVSQHDKECVDVITKAWTDFNAGIDRFDSNHDLITIITLRGSKILLADFSGLLDCARAAKDHDDFTRRMESDGLISKKAKEYYQHIQSILREHCSEEPDGERLWAFLRVLCLISLDLNTRTAQTEALIKSMLLVCAVGDGSITAAADTWSSLLELVGHHKPLGTAFRYENLPEDLRNRHGAAVTPASELIKRLADHSAPVLKNIHTTIGADNYHCSRAVLEGQLIEQLNRSRIVIMSGPAGAGKSALAKNVLDAVSSDSVAFAFRADEFAVAHVDHVFHMAQIPEPLSRLKEYLATHGRKVFLIESAERLIEKTERSALVDFLGLICEDPSWFLIVTCRDYHLDQVRSLFGRAGLEYTLLHVPVLDDGAIDDVGRNISNIAGLAQNPRLRVLLRNPFLLRLAVDLRWSSGEDLPSTIGAFRAKVWRDVVCDETNEIPSISEHRASTFMEIARIRAQALSPYASCQHLDREILDKLRSSSLITYSPDTKALAAIDHDVLEDWAIIMWINEQYAVAQGDYVSFINEVGAHPAMRRAYRSWLGEYLESSPVGAMGFVVDATTSPQVSRQHQDDTLVSVLASPAASMFIEANEAQLMSEGTQLLRRLIHLVRIACKTPWDAFGGPGLKEVLVARHDIWQPVLWLLDRHLEKFDDQDEEFLIAFLDDWCFGLDPMRPLPPGATEVASIAFELLDRLSRHQYVKNEVYERVYSIISKVPHAHSERFKALIATAIQNGRKDRRGRILAEVLLSELGEATVCKEFPEETIALAYAHWLGSSVVDSPLCPIDYGHNGIEAAFNVHLSSKREFFPPSAYHGPFWQLLRFHPWRAMGFIVDLLNKCSEHYAAIDGSFSDVDQIQQISIVLADKTVCTQWFSKRLWCIHRGSETSSYVLECALMALERFLMDLCRHEHPEVEQCMMELIKLSNNVAVTATVGSVAMAYPDLGGRIGLALLSCLDLFDADRTRSIKDRNPIGSSLGLVGGGRANSHFYQERVEADALEHRKSNLEHLILQLQRGPLRDDIWALIDQHKKGMPDLDKQDDEDRLRRLLLARIDIRGFVVAEEQPEPDKVYFELGHLDTDIKEMIARDAPYSQHYLALMALQAWAHAGYLRERTGDFDPSLWRSNLAQIQAELENGEEDAGYFVWHLRMAAGMYTAAICIRDHWNEMAPDERTWCCELVLWLMQVHDKEDNSHLFQSLTDPTEAGCRMLSLLLTKDLDPTLHGRVHAAFVRALSHPIEDIVIATLRGAGEYLQGVDPLLLERSIHSAYETAKVMHEMHESRRSRQQSRQESWAETRATIRDRVSQVMEGAEITLLDREILFDLSRDWGKAIARRLITVYSQLPAGPQTYEFLHALTEALVTCWRNDNRNEDRRYERRDYQLESDCVEYILDVCLGLEPERIKNILGPLFYAVIDCPEEISRFISQMIYRVDSLDDCAPFWYIWQEIADVVVSADSEWHARIHRDHDDVRSVINNLFLGIKWKQGIKHWRHLHGNHHRLDNLFRTLPLSPTLLRAYSVYLYTVGELSLPQAFETIATRLQTEGNPGNLFSGGARSFLDFVLLRYVYGDAGTLKAKPSMRKAVLFLLDILSDAGSPAAYMMRDDFVTPLPSQAELSEVGSIQ